MKLKTFILALCLLSSIQASFSQLIIDHLCTDITTIPQEAINTAKGSLHIAYGHTSHGSQVTDGMSGLINFANNGGRGLALPTDIFAWNHGGSDGALDLHNYAMDGDVGYYPDWYNNTVSYLEDEANSDVNVIMWSWCGQVGNKYSDGVLWDEFLGPMSALELAYPGVVFVYMTGHLDYGNRINTNAANDSIRSFCRNNSKVLFDFADIESYSPDGTCYKESGDDACDYYTTDGDSIGNWAIEYQDSHIEGTDWYNCGAQHSEPLNANRKAYAAWYMFASLAGWNYIAPPLQVETAEPVSNIKAYPNPASTELTVELDIQLSQLQRIDIFSANGQRIKQIDNFYAVNGGSTFSFTISDLDPGIYLLHCITDEGSRSLQFSVSR